MKIRILHILYLLRLISKEKYKEARRRLKYMPFVPKMEYIGKYSYSGKDIEIISKKQK